MAPAGCGAPGPATQRQPGPCARSAVRLGPSRCPSVRDGTPRCADVGAPLEPDRTIGAIGQKAVPGLARRPRSCIMSTGTLHVYSTRSHDAHRRVEAMVDLTLAHIRRSCPHWRRIDNVHRADDKSFIEGRVEYSDLLRVIMSSGTPAPRRKTLGILPCGRKSMLMSMVEGPIYFTVSSPRTVLRSTSKNLVDLR
jgi:hypothetical protein